MTSVYDQKTATYMYGREQYAEGKALGIELGRNRGRAQGLAQGRIEGRTEGIVDLLNKQIINLSVAAKELNMSEKEVLKLAKRV